MSLCEGVGSASWALWVQGGMSVDWCVKGLVCVYEYEREYVCVT